jgi:uncharacterized protein (DUF4415 family)
MSPNPPVALDDDNPEWTAADFARASQGDAVPEAIRAAFPVVRKAGRPVGSSKADAKQQVTLRLDRDVLERFRATGPGWQSRINDALRDAVGAVK